MRLAPDTRLGAYSIHAALGARGTGESTRAQPTRTCNIAMKMILITSLEAPSARKAAALDPIDALRYE